MKQRWLTQNNNKKVIIYFSGWSMDGSEVAHLETGDFDVICFYDYRKIEAIDFPKNYDHYFLISWSFGVFSASHCLEMSKTPLFTKKIAINGTTKPVDNGSGIPEITFQKTIKNYNFDSRLKFLRRTCGSKSDLDLLLQQGELRDTNEQKEELVALENLFKTVKLTSQPFEEVIITTKDFIIPTKNQYNFWQEQGVVIKSKKGAHLPFFQWDSWSEIIDAE